MTTEQKYQERLKRYVTAMRKGQPDMVPIRPLAAEFCAKYAGYSCQEVTHDYETGFAAVRKCATDFDWDAVVSNMVYVWTGLTEAIGLTYYAAPGIGLGANNCFQYLEPPEDQAFMKSDEYDALIDDPTAFLFDVWLPRVTREVCSPGEPNTLRNNLSFLKGGMAMLSYFNAFGEQNRLLRTECGTVPAISGILKAPLDIIGDKLRGYVGLSMDLIEKPQTVLKACEALMPHLLHVAKSTADPENLVPIGFWMHRGCVPFISFGQFNRYYWPTLKPIIEELWSEGHQTLFYAEGNWDYHLDSFAELPELSIVYHVDQGDIGLAKKALGNKFCISGGIPNYLLSYGTPDEVRGYCKQIIDRVAQEGGYILDASAIMQNDTSVENLQVLTDFAREYGVYGSTADPIPKRPSYQGAQVPPGRVPPGVCFPWAEKLADIPRIEGDADLVRRIWEDVDSFAHTYIWQCLLSF